VIPEIDPKYYLELKSAHVIFAGMLPKLDNAFSAINKGVKKVVVGKAERLSALIGGTSGTTIVNSDRL
jgi:acetylglutamate kinase